MTALAILDQLRARGVQVERDGPNLSLRPAEALTPDLVELVRAHKAELLPLVDPEQAAPDTWRSDREGWPPAKHARWAARAAVYEALDRLPGEQADQRAFVELRAEPDGRAWVVAGGGDGMALFVRSAPPWPPEIHEAAGIAELVDRHHRAGDDERAAAAARRLEEKLAELRRAGLEAWLATGGSLSGGGRSQ